MPEKVPSVDLLDVRPPLSARRAPSAFVARAWAELGKRFARELAICATCDQQSGGRCRAMPKDGSCGCDQVIMEALRCGWDCPLGKHSQVVFEGGSSIGLKGGEVGG